MSKELITISRFGDFGQLELFSYTLKETRNGYESPYGHDIGLYGGAIGAILLGAALIWRAITSI